MKEITALRAGFSMGRAQGLAKVEEFPPYYYPGGLAAKQPQSHTESHKQEDAVRAACLRQEAKEGANRAL